MPQRAGDQSGTVDKAEIANDALDAHWLRSVGRSVGRHDNYCTCQSVAERAEPSCGRRSARRMYSGTSPCGMLDASG